jgi:RNA polymerase sigma-70 factor, ECF subfamily
MMDGCPCAMNLKEIYEQHASFVWRTLLRLGVAESEAHDGVQDVFLQAHAHLHEFQGRSSLKTWLFAVTRSVARERRRRGRLAAHAAPDAELDDVVDLRADVGRAVEHQERLRRLETILKDMPPEQRTVFVLFEIERFTGEEIGEALGIATGTVFTRLLAARKAFQAALSRIEARERFSACRAGETS